MAKLYKLMGQMGDPGRSGTDNHRFLNEVLWVLRSRAHWHDLRKRYGKWKTNHRCCQKERLRKRVPTAAQRPEEPICHD